MKLAYLCSGIVGCLALFMLGGCGPLPMCGSANEGAEECVVLLHGLARSNRAMAPLAKALEAEGFRVANLDYPSTRKTIAEIAQEDYPRALTCFAHSPPCARINFVTHSMGGIVLRRALSESRPANLGRVVMISPPNQGSEVADLLNNSWWLGWFYRWYNGPAGQELGVGPGSVPLSLGPVDYPVGVLTGDRHHGFDNWFAGMIPGADDGKVAVERAKVAGMSDFLVLSHHHTSIMKQEEVIEQVICFLKSGRFCPQGQDGKL
ncbi:MAG: alpha/beta fold hydrolase [Thermodesulfobacteriota bacterium]